MGERERETRSSISYGLTCSAGSEGRFGKFGRFGRFGKFGRFGRFDRFDRFRRAKRRLSNSFPPPAVAFAIEVVPFSAK